MGISCSRRNHSLRADEREKNKHMEEKQSDTEEDSGGGHGVKHIEKIPGEIPATPINGEKMYKDSEDVFYKFVILHSTTDINEALRVKNLLQGQFHIRPGIIFAEMPAGRHILKNLEDAINSSAWTILLLTENFLNETWCEFQFHATLINSVNMQHKYNSVIPVRPETHFLPRKKTPMMLQLINALEERSPAFRQQVEKTFKESQFQKQRTIWKAEREGVELIAQD
ncbi:TIR domain-containing adapter molecule 2 [Ascaphus truei]|uniref:TIR domain-containing adapter molecule 2 n=1 Tax=Ascaphus truei TaxID=8439 RepID=UPI003F5A04CC